MKRTFVIVSLIVLGGCVTQQEPMKSTFSMTMIAMNQGQPFVSQKFAERLAGLVIDDRYPRDFFVPHGSGTATDKGETWEIAFDNELIDRADRSPMPMLHGQYVPRRLTIVIRKSNAEIVDIK